MEGSCGDAARVWHLLDEFLPALREARDGFAEAGLEDEAGTLQEVIEVAEAKYAEAGREVAVLPNGECR